MATPATPTTGPIPVRDITPRSGRPSGRLQNETSAQTELRNARRTAGTGIGRSQHVVRSLVQLHKSTAEVFNQKQSKHVQELSATTISALQDIKKPSTARHSLDIALCLFVDTVVMAALTALILGGAVSAGAATAAGIAASVIIAFLMWPIERLVLGKSAKKNKEQRKLLQKSIAQVKKDVEGVKDDFEKFKKWARLAARRYPQVATKITSTGARLGRAAKAIKPIGKLVSWVTRVLKNPAVKGTAESVPGSQILPWWTIGAIAAWVANRAEYKEAQRLLEEFRAAKSEVYGMTDDIYTTQLAVIENELVEKTAQSDSELAITA